MSSEHCQNCGTVITATSPGAVVSVAPPAFEAFRMLFGPKFPNIRCFACGHDTDLRPIVELIWPNSPRIVGMPGSLKGGAQRLQQVADTAKRQLQIVSGEEQIRDAVIAEVRQVRTIINDLEIAFFRGEAREWIRQEWRRLSTDVLFTAMLVMEVSLPGIPVAVAIERDGDMTIADVLDEQTRRLAQAQLGVWTLLLDDWIFGRAKTTMFDEDLARFVDGSPRLPNVVDSFLEICDTQISDPHLQAARYPLLAMRAAACAAAGVENERAAEWTEALIGFEWVAAVKTDDALLGRLRISAARGRATIDPDALWDATARRSRDDQASALRPVLERLGEPDLLPEVTVHAPIATGDYTVESLLRSLRNVLEKEAIEIESFVAGAQMFARGMIAEGRANDLEPFAEGVIEAFGATAIARGYVEQWLASYLKQLARPQRILARLGETENEWEKELPPELRSSLLNERASAFRLMGRPKDALQLVRRAIELSDHRMLRLNEAIFLRECGYADRSRSILEALLPGAPRHEAVRILMSLAATCTALGANDATEAYLRSALRVARGPYADNAPAIRASLATHLSAQRKFTEAEAELVALGRHRTSAGGERVTTPGIMTAISECAAWVNLLNARQVITDEGHEAAQTATQNLRELLIAADAQGARIFVVLMMKVLAWMAEAVEPETAETLWQGLETTIAEEQEDEDSDVLAALAWFDARASRWSDALTRLERLPAALAVRLGGITDLSAAANASFMLGGRLHAILGRFAAGATLDQIRCVAEARRDVVGRLIGTGQAMPGGTFLPTDERLHGLCEESGPVTVVEILDVDDQLAILRSTISSDGLVSARSPVLPEVDLDGLTKRLRQKLANWYEGRPGDPFDDIEWRTLETWLRAELEDLPDDASVVFIEPGLIAGLPWHVAVVDRLTPSYAPSWSALFAARTIPRPELTSFGLALVPRFREVEEVAAAMTASADATRRLAHSRGWSLHAAEGPACDASALRNLLQTTAAAKLVCHGYLSASTHEVAFMIAYEGRLPAALSIAAAAPGAELHRFSWRDCRELERSPAIVFSGGCSTGISHSAGLDERMGLWSVLRGKGTIAIVAPRWDIVVPAALPQLDRVVELYCSGRNAGEAVRDAIRERLAAGRWIAAAFAVEGDWTCRNR